MIVLDYEGNQRSVEWLKAKYGNFQIKETATGYKISTLREDLSGITTQIVRVFDKDGNPVVGEKVAWYWPDAPEDQNAGPQGGLLPGMVPNRCVWGEIKESGDTGFGMGRGAYYFPQEGQIGPHAVWVYGADALSDVILGLGMVGETEHHHFNVDFQWVVGDEEPPAPPTDGVKFYNAQGGQETAEWAATYFGTIAIHQPDVSPKYKLVELHEATGDHRTFAPRFLDQDGNPVVREMVFLQPRDVAGEVEYAYTDINGYAIFSLVDKGEYPVPGQGNYVGGPAEFPGDIDDCVGVVLRSKPKRWLNPVWRLVTGVTPPVDDNWETLFAKLDTMSGKLDTIINLLGG